MMMFSACYLKDSGGGRKMSNVIYLKERVAPQEEEHEEERQVLECGYCGGRSYRIYSSAFCACTECGSEVDLILLFDEGDNK
jgi:hypothetical protein